MLLNKIMFWKVWYAKCYNTWECKSSVIGHRRKQNKTNIDCIFSKTKRCYGVCERKLEVMMIS